MIIHPLRPENDRLSFSSGDASLDEFFSSFALQNQRRHRIGVTYVAEEAGVILGFMTLSAASLRAEELSDRALTRFPRYPLPVLRVARMAVDERFRGQGIGSELLAAAFEIALDMSKRIGCVGLVVDSKVGAVRFYERFGFTELETMSGASTVGRSQPVMFLDIGSVEAAIG